MRCVREGLGAVILALKRPAEGVAQAKARATGTWRDPLTLCLPGEHHKLSTAGGRMKSGFPP